MKPLIEIRWCNGKWEARSDDPRQGSVSATDEIVLKVVADWMAARRPDGGHMSTWEDDGALVAEDLAELVNEGRLTDAEALGALAGVPAAETKVSAVIAAREAEREREVGRPW